MVIKASSRRQVETLLDDLSSSDASSREAAVARLIVIGPRAVGRLIEFVKDSKQHDAAARTAALRALEAIGDSQSFDLAVAALDDPDSDVAMAAAAVLRSFVAGPHGARAVEALTRVAMDQQRPDSLRLTAIDALRLLDRSSHEALVSALEDDPSDLVRRSLERTTSRRMAPLDAASRLKAAAEGGDLGDPAALQQAIVESGDGVTLGVLREVIDRIRDREARETGPQRTDWMVARAAAHVVLAHRGSRIAFYDVRETLAAATGPLPVEFLTALGLLGDVSCLEAIAAAHARAAGEIWWRDQLSDAFHTIVVREHITRRHAVMKKIEKRWKNGLASTAFRDTARPRRRI